LLAADVKSGEFSLAVFWHLTLLAVVTRVHWSMKHLFKR
jgi:hypothetical protein